MSNWIADEFQKFKRWIVSENVAVKAKVTSLESRIAELEKAKTIVQEAI